ncbi:hypothetical protein ACLK1S_16795 [Escherichia coli]
MSEEKLGQHYLAALNEAFPGVVLDHALADQRLADCHRKGERSAGSGGVSGLQAGGWLSVLFGNDANSNSMVITPFIGCACR